MWVRGLLSMFFSAVCCAVLLTFVSRGKDRHIGPALAWLGLQMLFYRSTKYMFLFIRYTYPSPSLAYVVPRNFCYNADVLLLWSTHCIVVSWVVVDVLFCSVLCCTTAVLRTAFVRGGWADRFVIVSIGSCFLYFLVLVSPDTKTPR